MPTFTPTARLSQPDHYRRVFDSPEYKVSSSAFLLLAAPGATQSSRLGVVVAKKAIRRAARRNRIKRLVRECFRLHAFVKPVDLVVLARRSADELDSAAVTKDLQALCRALDKKASTG